MPALPLDEAGLYVAAAYVVFVTLIVVYVVIIAGKVSRMERQLETFERRKGIGADWHG